MKAYLIDLRLQRNQPVFSGADRGAPLAPAIIAGAVSDGLDAVIGAVRSAVVHVWSLNERRRQRRTLADLDPYLLRDIGIDRHQAMAEASKPFWRA